MADLIIGLLPPALGIVASPLAIMALIAVLLSPRARVNGVMYFIGWALAVILTVSVAYAVFGAVELRADREPPLWVPIVRLLLGVVLLVGAVWAHTRGRARVVQMSTANSPEQVVEASPRLPGWLQAVAKFSGVQSLLLGLGVFVLNPVDLSCAIVAGLDIRLAEIAPGSAVWYIVGFALVGILPIGVPVVLVLVKGKAADPALNRLRDWLAVHNSVLNVAMLAIVGFMQLQKAVAALT